MAWLAGWSYRKEIDVQDAYVDGDLTDFPLYVKRTADADLAEALATGYDIRFTQSDGETLLYYEREAWAGGNGSAATADFWVRVPSIAATGGANIFMYYGKADAPDGQDSANTWDSSFECVLHMKDDPDTSTVQDSTSHGVDGTKKGANEPVEASGKIGQGQQFDGTNDYISGSIAELFRAAKTFSCWLYRTAADQFAFANIGPNLSNIAPQTLAHVYASGGLGSFGIKNGGGYDYLDSVETVSTDAWHHLVFLDDLNPAQGYHLYLDGAECTYTVGSQGAYIDYTNTSNYLYLGGGYDNQYGTGILDEVRISSVARSAAWIKFEYRNVAEADNELTWGEEESEGPPPAFFLYPGIFDQLRGGLSAYTGGLKT